MVNKFTRLIESQIHPIGEKSKPEIPRISYDEKLKISERGKHQDKYSGRDRKLIHLASHEDVPATRLVNMQPKPRELRFFLKQRVKNALESLTYDKKLQSFLYLLRDNNWYDRDFLVFNKAGKILNLNIASTVDEFARLTKNLPYIHCVQPLGKTLKSLKSHLKNYSNQSGNLMRPVHPITGLVTDKLLVPTSTKEIKQLYNYAFNFYLGHPGSERREIKSINHCPFLKLMEDKGYVACENFPDDFNYYFQPLNFQRKVIFANARVKTALNNLLKDKRIKSIEEVIVIRKAQQSAKSKAHSKKNRRNQSHKPADTKSNSKDSFMIENVYKLELNNNKVVYIKGFHNVESCEACLNIYGRKTRPLLVPVSIGNLSMEDLQNQILDLAFKHSMQRGLAPDQSIKIYKAAG